MKTSTVNLNYVKTIIWISLVISGFSAQAQKKFIVEKGEVRFTSNAILEVIKASSDKIQGLIDPTNGNFAFVVKIQSFVGFNSSLQREHFNEKYMETEKYYDASFTGTIIEPIDFSKDGTYDVQAKGTLIVHGVKQIRTIASKIKIDRGILKVDSHFKVLLADHDIKIPTIVSEKIATEILITVDALMVSK